MMVLVFLYEETKASSLSPHCVRIQKKKKKKIVACTPGRELSPGTGAKSASTLILDFLAGPEL